MEQLIPSEPHPLSKEATKFVDELNAQWGATQNRRQRLADEVKRLEEIDPLAFTAADSKAKQRNREEAIEILQAEIPILKSLTKWPTMLHAERSAAKDQARSRQTQAANAIIKKLAALGFTPDECAKGDLSEDERRQTGNAVGNAVESLAYLHPTVLPYARLSQAIGMRGLGGSDVNAEQINDRIKAKQDELRKLIAAL